MVQTMLKLVTSHEPIFRVASKTESMEHSVPPLSIVACGCTRWKLEAAHNTKHFLVLWKIILPLFPAFLPTRLYHRSSSKPCVPDLAQTLDCQASLWKFVFL